MSNERISVESVKKLVDLEDHPEVIGLYRAKTAELTNNQLFEQWKAALDKEEVFPKFDDGYDEDFYHDEDDEKALNELEDFYREEELLDREDRRDKLKKMYDECLEEHKQKFKHLYVVSKAKPSPAKPKSTPKSAPKQMQFNDDSSSSLDDDSDDLQVSDDDTESDAGNFVASDSSSVVESEEEKKPAKKEQPAPARQTNGKTISYNDLLNATISGSRLRLILGDFKNKLKKDVIIFIHYRKDDHTSIGYLKHTDKSNDYTVFCYDVIMDSYESTEPQYVLDEKIPHSLYDKIHHDLSGMADKIKRGIKFLKNNIETKAKTTHTETFSDLERMYNFAMNGNLQNLSIFKQQLIDEIKKFGDEDDLNEDSDTESSSRVSTMKKWIEDLDVKIKENKRTSQNIEDIPVAIVNEPQSAFQQLVHAPRRTPQKQKEQSNEQEEQNYKNGLLDLFGSGADGSSGTE